jgi:hypothetical protein
VDTPRIGIGHRFFQSPALSKEVETRARPVVSLKPITDYTGPKIQNMQRSVWHYLTLGIPLLIDSLSVFFTNLLHRETVGQPLRVRFKYGRLPLDQAGQLIKFQQYNQTSHTPLNDAVRHRGLQKITSLTKRVSEAMACGNEVRVFKAQQKLATLRKLLEKNETSKAIRGNFNENDWKIVDKIEFDLAQEYLLELTDLFNTEWLASSGVQEHLKEEFGINYQESVIAETLALMIAYIEGIEGKVIFLPVYDKVTGKYNSVEFLIKSTVLGDSLPCYILENESSKVNPWMLVRGTQRYIGVSSSNKEYRQGGLESILADSLDPDCISRNVINKAVVTAPVVKLEGETLQKKSLTEIFSTWKEEGKTVNLSGHSLGGTIVNTLTVEFYDQINTAYSFSAAGVSNKTEKRWNKYKQQNPDQTHDKKIVNFDYEGDIVPSGGRKLIGTHLALKAILQIGPQGLANCHGKSHLNRDFEIQKIDTEKESNKFSRRFCENLRSIVGRCFHALLWLFGHKYIPDWWKNRNVYHQQAKAERKIRRTYPITRDCAQPRV